MKIYVELKGRVKEQKKTNLQTLTKQGVLDVEVRKKYTWIAPMTTPFIKRIYGL